MSRTMNPIIRKARVIILYVLLAFGLFWLLIYWRQYDMVFYPIRELDAQPTDWGLAYEDVRLTTEDGVQLHGWYVPHPGSNRALLFLHGNGGNISHRGDSLLIFHRLGFNVLIIDYRGYGQSDGRASESGLYRDARAAWRHLLDVRKFPPHHIVVFGRSLGGAVAADLATRVTPAAVILESVFTRYRDMAALYFPVMSRAAWLRYEFDTLAKMPRIKVPVLVLHSRNDEIIPYIMGEQLYAAAARPRLFGEMQGDHNSGFLQSQPGYAQLIGQFSSTYLPPGVR